MKKLTTILLLLALTLGAVSCGSEPEITEMTTVADETTVPEETTIGSELPELNYNDETVTILVEDYEGYVGAEFYVDEANGDIVNDAVFNRNRVVEEQLNVNLEWVGITHYWGDRDSFLTKFRSSILASDSAYDIAAGIGYFMPSFAGEGLLADMSSLPYIDIEKPWWSKDYMDKSAVDGKYYAATGDISLGMIKDMMCIFENLGLAEALGVESLYDVVRAGDWTLEKMKKLTSDIYADLDGDTKIGRGDQFGFLFPDSNQFTGFLEAFDVNIVDFSGDEPEFVFGNAHNTDVVEKLVDLITNYDGIYFEDTVDARVFSNGNVLLTGGWLTDTDTYRELKFNYGVLPYPKYDESQESYKTTVLNNHSVVTIPVDSNDRERAAAICEALAYESWKSVTPAYFETALKVKYARDNDSAQMFDIIREGVSFDFGYIYTASLNGISDKFKGAVKLGKPWASEVASLESATKEKLTSLVAAIRDKAE